MISPAALPLAQWLWGCLRHIPLPLILENKTNIDKKANPNHVCPQSNYGAAAVDRGWAGDVLGLFNSVLSHTCVVPWKNVLFLVVLLAKAEEFTLGWLAERYMSHMFVSCRVHVARE